MKAFEVTTIKQVSINGLHCVVDEIARSCNCEYYKDFFCQQYMVALQVTDDCMNIKRCEACLTEFKDEDE